VTQYEFIMPQVKFVKAYPTLQVESGALLMEALLKAGLPVASSCHGDGICGKCRVQVVAGSENLTPANAIEALVRERLRVPSGYRISCQTRVMGDITIDTAYW
jgi:2Fe-2S ferredoxin